MLHLQKHSLILFERILIGLNKHCWPYTDNNFVDVVVKYIYFSNRIIYNENVSRNYSIATIENYCYNGLIFGKDRFLECLEHSIPYFEIEFQNNKEEIKKKFGVNPIISCTIPDL